MFCDISATAMRQMTIAQEEKLSNETSSGPSEISNLEKHLVKRKAISATTEVDSIRAGANFQFTYFDIFSSFISIVFRCSTVYLNGRLAYDYYNKEQTNYFVWTILCILVPLGITSAIHCYMCYEDGKFKNGFFQSLQTVGLVFLSSIFLRYWTAFVYAIKCKHAEQKRNKESQIRFYKLAIREESDVAFLRLFECFLESAPQKILQISIVLAQKDNVEIIQIIVICMHFGSMAWCLAAYHRYVRFAQEDKFNINLNGLLCHLFWHFSISVSRSLCIAFVASIFPLWSVVLCLCHAMLFGVLIFLANRPKCPENIILNFLFCLLFGIIYLFTFISTRDEPTKNKYLMYYFICFLENIGCIVTFLNFTSYEKLSSVVFVYLLCIGALAFYITGIISSALYYMRYHPKITARNDKGSIINNN